MCVDLKPSDKKTKVVTVQKEHTTMCLTRAEYINIKGPTDIVVRPRIKVNIRIEVVTPENQIMILSTLRIIAKNNPRKSIHENRKSLVLM